MGTSGSEGGPGKPTSRKADRAPRPDPYTEIPTGVDGRGPKLYLATVIDLYSRRLLGAATSRHPDAELACAAITMAVTARGGKAAIGREEEAERVIFHTDRGSTYTANAFTTLCRRMGI